jgi:hypothetical protein
MLTRKKQPNSGIAESSLCFLINSPSAELDCGEESDSELDSEFLDYIGFSTSDLPIVSQPSLSLDNQLPTFNHSLSLDDRPLDDRPPNFDHSLPLDDRPLSFENSLPLDNQPSLDLLDPIDQLTPKFCAVRQYHSIYQLGLILTNWH